MYFRGIRGRQHYSAAGKMCKFVRLWHTAPVLNRPTSKRPPADPAWRDLDTIPSGQLPPRSHDWLLDEGSLTERLIAASGGDFRVERLSQCWQQPLLSERRLLGLPGRQRALIREVVLRCREEPWIYATGFSRTRRIPRATHLPWRAASRSPPELVKNAAAQSRKLSAAIFRTRDRSLVADPAGRSNSAGPRVDRRPARTAD